MKSNSRLIVCTVGAGYARDTAQRLGIEHCFVGFLSKPRVVIDDQEFGARSGYIQNEIANPSR